MDDAITPEQRAAFLREFLGWISQRYDVALVQSASADTLSRNVHRGRLLNRSEVDDLVAGFTYTKTKDT